MAPWLASWRGFCLTRALLHCDRAVNDLFLQSVNGKLRFFPGVEPGAAVRFDRIRTKGAFLVSASRSATGVVSGVSLLSEAGAECSLHRAVGAKAPKVTAGGKGVVVRCAEGACSFATTAGTRYAIEL